jgi:hypothetical protein
MTTRTITNVTVPPNNYPTLDYQDEHGNPVQVVLPPIHPVWSAQLGERWLWPMGITPSGTALLVTNRAYFCPIWADTPISAIGVNVTTAGAAGAKGRCALYDMDAAGRPRNRITLGTEILLDSIGNKLSTFDEIEITQPRWLAFANFGAATVS